MTGVQQDPSCRSVRPLVSILIPAHNAQRWVGDAIASSLAQTWDRKEVIVVDDGSTDKTAWVARQFEGAGVKVISKANEGAAAARNVAYEYSRGDFLQWLDADDLLSPNKVAAQLARLADTEDDVLLSSAWGHFAYRPQCAVFAPSSLWQDLSPTEWLLRKLGENLHMQTATWLTSRRLAEAAGPWDTRLLVDDDGEYFSRVLLCSRGVRFVSDAQVYYRCLPTNRLSFVGTSARKMESLLVSMGLQVEYLQSLERSARVDSACLAYLKNSAAVFDPRRGDLLDELRAIGSGCGGLIERPPVRRKYAWIEVLFGRYAAWRAQLTLPRCKWRLECFLDRVLNLATGLLGRSSCQDYGSQLGHWCALPIGLFFLESW